MTRFRDLPIRRKLNLLVHLAIILALLLACVGLAVYERIRFRADIVGELTALADILGANSAASLTFNDPRTAQETLSALHAEEHVMAAILYDEQGNLFVQYRRPGLAPGFSPPALRPPSVEFGAQSLTLFRSVFLSGDSGRVGSIAIVSDMEDFHEEVTGYIKITVVVLFASMLLTSLVSRRLLRMVSDPISQVSGIASRVSLEEDYSLRATASGNDEVGRLVGAFNHMLAGIQQRDLALQAANDELEVRVQRRTAELEKEVQERKQAEIHMRAARDAAQVASQAKSEFLANMSHEIRTPLNGVIGMTELALDSQPGEEQRQYLETIKYSADSLLTVINDILDFSKIEAGKLELESLEFNLRDCLEEVLRPLSVRADEKNIELLCDIAPGVPEVVQGDSSRLRQVLLNLLGNAVKFTPSGEVALHAQLESADGDMRTIRFTVADSGIGIPPEKHACIFDPFTQADTSTTRKYGGTGLGLTICARLVAMMGGKIWFESSPGKGTRFHFTARLKFIASRAESSVLVPGERLRGMRVLIVDDNATNRRILQGLLHRWELRPHGASRGEQALQELLSAHHSGDPYGMILTDLHMPAMDGFALVERIRELPELSPIPIMMLTSAGHGGDAERCRKLGITSYLVKPVRKWELLKALLKTLGDGESLPALPAENRLDASRPARPVHILLAEDNRVNQTVAVRLLENMGHSVVVANNGKEALSLLAAQSFDLVLMDVQMPEMDGLTATRQIREQEKQTRAHLPIMAMTAHALKGDRERCLAAGMDGYLSKPINIRELRETIEALAAAFPRDPLPHPAPREPVAPAAPASWNAAQALERLGGDEALLREVIQIFLADTPGKLAALRGALDPPDPGAIEKIAHSLKGELGYLGIPAAAQTARELEEAGRKNDLPRSAILFAKLECEISAVVAVMKNAPRDSHFAAGAGQ